MSTFHDSGARLARFAQADVSISSSSFPGGSRESIFLDTSHALSSTFLTSPPISPDMNKLSAQSGDRQRSNSGSSSPDTNRKYYNPPTLIHPHLYKCTFAAATSRVPRRNDLRKFLDTPGIVWVNKIPFITALCPVLSRHWEDRLTLMRRPSGFGKTTFLSTSEFLHESANERPAAHVFGDHPSSLPPVRGDRLVLRVDVQEVFYDTGENMRRSVNEYMNMMIYHDFFVRYAEELDLSDTANLFHPTSRLTFDELVLLLPRSGHKLIILIDNFNWPLLKSTPENYVEISSFLRDCIIDPFRSALDDGCVVGGAIVGQPLEEEPTWVRSALLSQFNQIGCDISDEEQARGAFGFTFSEVQALVTEVLGESEGMKFVDEMKDAPNYCSGDNVEYSMRNTFERFSSFMGQKRPSYEWVDCGGNVRGRLVPPEEVFSI